MTKAELIELAERCERVEGADRDLDAAVCVSLRIGTEHAWAMANYPSWVAGSGGIVHLEKNGPNFRAPLFTTSLDAALTLVPEECFFRAGHDGDGADPSLFAAIVFEPLTMREPCSAVAETPALAICAAALRARASMMGDDA